VSIISFWVTRAISYSSSLAIYWLYVFRTWYLLFYVFLNIFSLESRFLINSKERSFVNLWTWFPPYKLPPWSNWASLYSSNRIAGLPLPCLAHKASQQAHVRLISDPTFPAYVISLISYISLSSQLHSQIDEWAAQQAKELTFSKEYMRDIIPPSSFPLPRRKGAPTQGGEFILSCYPNFLSHIPGQSLNVVFPQ
jgi:hypothetical protein